ncbi:hypothetical protein CLV46_1487 [Diaminobutyricimonas aerilata]|uniref:Uncharacterized protein n=1 Tax=Diaminobutyricimonas aerilata TaxID=1162967 RepID=A0A2M9CJ56_9MICO|nr:hypothetical protein [Diaminobutyricimonas aerilata]PJJ71931.1 hypothetical protein CLV46_1487 [Diaminobutyricimonas aerilata]
MPRQARPVTEADIRLTPMPGGWAVRDRRAPATGLDGLLAFVTQRGDLFEVVCVGRADVRSYCSSIEDVARQVVRRHVFMPPLPALIPPMRATEKATAEPEPARQRRLAAA